MLGDHQDDDVHHEIDNGRDCVGNSRIDARAAAAGDGAVPHVGVRGAGDVLQDDDDGVEEEVAPEDGVEDVEEGVAGSSGDEDPQPLDEDGGFDEAHVGAEYVDGEEDVLGGLVC